MSSKYNTVIFDLDGTLLNTLEDLADATNHALQSYNMPLRTIDEVRRFVGNGVRMLMIRAVPREKIIPGLKKYLPASKNIMGSTVMIKPVHMMELWRCLPS